MPSNLSAKAPHRKWAIVSTTRPIAIPIRPPFIIPLRPVVLRAPLSADHTPLQPCPLVTTPLRAPNSDVPSALLIAISMPDIPPTTVLLIAPSSRSNSNPATPPANAPIFRPSAAPAGPPSSPPNMPPRALPIREPQPTLASLSVKAESRPPKSLSVKPFIKSPKSGISGIKLAPRSPMPPNASVRSPRASIRPEPMSVPVELDALSDSSGSLKTSSKDSKPPTFLEALSASLPVPFRASVRSSTESAAPLSLLSN